MRRTVTNLLVRCLFTRYILPRIEEEGKKKARAVQNRYVRGNFFLHPIEARALAPHGLARRCGIQPDTIYECLALLNRPAEEVEGVLF